MYRPFILMLSILAASGAADFLISNTTVCMGAFPFDSCYAGVAVLSRAGNATDYLCSDLVSAEDNNHVDGEGLGSPRFHVEGGICNSGRLSFVQGDTGYMVTDKHNKHVGDCRPDTVTGNNQHCSQWLGSTTFRSAYYCTSSICD